MKTIHEGNKALTEVPYEGNQNYPAGVHVYEWTREPVTLHPTRFEVRVYVEGYRLTKDTWLHETYNFDTLDEALAFYHKANNASRKEQEEMFDFEGATKYNGWYGLSLEYMEVYEHTPEGTFKWATKAVTYTT